MAEISIVGFVVGSLGFAFTIRKAIEQLLLDADTFQTHTETLTPLSAKLELLSIQLEVWQSFWHIHDGTSTDLFSSYWGVQGSQRIRALLSSVHKQFEKVEAEFELRYGHLLQNLIQCQNERTSCPRTYSKDQEQLLLENHCHSYSRKTNPIKRLNSALFTGSIFHRHLDNLENYIRSLQDLSKFRFVEHVCDYDETEWKDHVEFTAARDSLTRLANHSSITSQALRDALKGSEDHNIDFNLDHGSTPDQRKKQIFEFATKCSFPYYFCVLPRHSSRKKSLLRLQCQEETRSSTSDINWDRGLQQALQKLCCDEDNSDELNAYIRLPDNAPSIVISRCYLPKHDFKNLRTFMISTRSDFARNLHGEFSRPERTRLAYQLVESALLFLKTNWFSELCSCCIYRLENDSMRTFFTVRINELRHADHVDPQTGRSDHKTQWCEQELRQMHIRRLGVLLTEIATGSPIFDVAFNKRENDVELDFDVYTTESEPIRESHFKDILARVHRESGEDFMDAVGYCLKQGMVPRDVAQVDLEEFYDHVVEPLLGHYNKDVVELARRRQHRRHHRTTRKQN